MNLTREFGVSKEIRASCIVSRSHFSSFFLLVPRLSAHLAIDHSLLSAGVLKKVLLPVMDVKVRRVMGRCRGIHS